MRELIKEKVKTFAAFNDLALQGEIVVLGSTYMANFPFYELINKCQLENAVYNRSIEGLTPHEAEEILQVAVLSLRPHKVFLCFEETEGLGELITQIRTALPHAELYVVGVQTSETGSLCDGKNVRYIGIPAFDTQAVGYRRIFKRLCCFFRDVPLTLTDAFAMAAL